MRSDSPRAPAPFIDSIVTTGLPQRLAGPQRRQRNPVGNNEPRSEAAGPRDEANLQRESLGSGRQTTSTASGSDSRTSTGSLRNGSRDTDVPAVTSRSQQDADSRNAIPAYRTQRQPHAVHVTHAPMTEPSANEAVKFND